MWESRTGILGLALRLAGMTTVSHQWFGVLTAKRRYNMAPAFCCDVFQSHSQGFHQCHLRGAARG